MDIIVLLHQTGYLIVGGSNNEGQLGNGTTNNPDIVRAVVNNTVLSGKTIKSLSSGMLHSCAIASDDLAYCWGKNTSGQLGNNSTTQSSTPVAVNTAGTLNGKTIKQISAGNSHACVVASDNLAYCWGDNSGGQLGNNSTAQSNVPVAVSMTGILSGKTIKMIDAGNSHTCAIASDNLAYCWGYGYYGELGNSSNTQSTIPVAVSTVGVLSGKTIKSIVASDIHTCAIASDDLAYCWGYNNWGELGNNSTVTSNIPVAVNISGVLSGKTVKSITAAYYHTCIVASDNQAYCWGYNLFGQLGNNTTVDNSVPVAVYNVGALAGKTIKSISAGFLNTCVIASDDQVYCWGHANYGQLGNNQIGISSVPVYSVSTP